MLKLRPLSMYLIKSRFTIILLILLGGIAILLLGLHLGARSFIGTASSAQEYFSETATPYQLDSVNYDGRILEYYSTGLDSAGSPIILFIHGAPGSWLGFKEFLADEKLRGMARLISMNRPGYGHNSDGIATISIAEQAKAAKLILDKYESSKVMLVGHSYGGPILAKLAADYQGKIKAGLMIAPVNDPVSEPVKWYAYLCDLPILRSILPSFIQVATAEKMSHKTELHKMIADWSKIAIPIVHYHGGKDRLAPYEENIAFSKKHIKPDYLEVITNESHDHLVIWNQIDVILDLIISLFNEH